MSEDVADSAPRGANGRFPGVFENGFSAGTSKFPCLSPPCAWWLAGAAGGSGAGHAGPSTAEGSAAFNTGGRVAIPEFFIPPLRAVTIELFFAPACNTTGASATQSLFRLLTETTAFSPRILLERGEVTAYLALNDAASNSSYFAGLRQLKARASTTDVHGGGVWVEREWHQVALVFNGSRTTLFVDGNASATWQENGGGKQLGDACLHASPSKCERGRGVALGEGFNGRMQRVVVYDRALEVERVRAHFDAFFNSASGAAAWRAVSPGGSGSGFQRCRLPFDQRDAHVGGGLVPPIMSFLVVGIGLGALHTAVAQHLSWSNLAHGGGDLINGIMSTRVAIPEHSVVLDNPPQYPTVVLGLLGLLLPLAYLSQWYNDMDVTTQDARELYVMHYVFWLACECGGTLLLLALSNLHDPQGLGGLGLQWTSCLTVALALYADLYGGLEGASRSSLCPRPVQGPPPLDLGRGGWGEFWNLGGEGMWGWGCLPPVDWYCPVTAVALLSMTPVYILTSFPVQRSHYSHRVGDLMGGETAEQGDSDGDDVPLLRQEAAGAGVREGGEIQWGLAACLLRFGRMAAHVVWGEENLDDVGARFEAEESSVCQRSSRSRTLSMLRFWFFGFLTLRRIGWILVVGLRASHLTDDQRLLMMGSVDSVCVAVLAVLVWSSKATDWPSAVQRRRARSGLPPPSSNPSDSDHVVEEEESQHWSDHSEACCMPGEGARGGELPPPTLPDAGDQSRSCRDDDNVQEPDSKAAKGAQRSMVSDGMTIAGSRALAFGLEEAGAGAGAGDAGAAVASESGSSHSEVMLAGMTAGPESRGRSEVSGEAPWTDVSSRRSNETLLFRELRQLGYMVWRDPLRHTMQAASGEEFQVSQRLGLIISCSTLLALATFLFVKAATPVLDVDCWTSAAALLDKLNVSSSTDAFVPMRAPLVLCRSSCTAKQNLLSAVFGTDAHSDAAALEDGHVLWGWNDVFGGVNEQIGYADKSALCRSAVHAGLLHDESVGLERLRAAEWGWVWVWAWLNAWSSSVRAHGGCFSVQIIGGQAVYGGVSRNGVESYALKLDEPSAFGYRVVQPWGACPADFGGYALLCIVPLCSALVASCLPPPFLWTSLLCVTYWLQVLFDTLPVQNAGGQLLGRELFWRSDGNGWVEASVGHTGGYVIRTLLLLAVSPLLYLVGPAWVLRSPPWLWHFPFPASQKHWQRRLPVPARNPRELVTRNFLGFALPLLIGGCLRPLLPFLQTILVGLPALLRAEEHSQTARVGSWFEAELAGFEGIVVSGLVLALLAACVRWCYRSGELGRLGTVYIVLALALSLVYFAVQSHYRFVLRGYFAFGLLVPLTAQDKHAACTLQGLLLGMAIRDLATNGPLPLWEYQSASNL